VAPNNRNKKSRTKARKKALNQNAKTDRLKGAARVQRVSELLTEGMSMRAIGKELDYDDGTIRRDVKKLGLGSEQLEAIMNGESSEQFLAADKRRRKIEREKQELRKASDIQQRRRSEEMLDGRHSDAVSADVLDGLQDLPLCKADEHYIGDHLESAVDRAMNARRGDLARSPVADLGPFFTTAAWTGNPGDAPQWVDACFDNTVRAVLAGAPEQIIRDNSVKKIDKGLRDRKRRPLPVGNQDSVFGTTVIRLEPRKVYPRDRNV
jgi:hypothetical protein